MFQFQPSGGSPTPEGIVVELMTNQWNTVWLDVGNERIRRVLWPRDLRERSLRAGERYRPPAPSDRRGIEDPLEAEEWLEILEPVEPEKRRSTLLRSVAFTSSVSAPSLLGVREGARAPKGASGSTEALSRGYRLWRRIREVSLGRQDPEPRLVHTEKRVLPYPLSLPHTHSEPCPSLLDGFRTATSMDAGQEGGPTAALLPSSLLDRLEDAVQQARVRSQRLRGELDDSPDPEPIRRIGDLLLARFGEVPRGRESVTLESFGGEPVEIDLDPTLPPDENAERFYRRAARAERARERLPRLIDQADRKTADLEELLDRARSGEASADEIRSALPEEASAEDTGDSTEGTGLPYRRYRSSGGLEIRVGKGAKANDDLTFHHSNPEDIWMHARRVTGAHVILRWNRDDNPPSRDLAQAASLAALHSEARHAGSVPVDWTRRKYVRSPRKSPPGVVVPDRIQTLFVEPDSRLEKALREQ